MAAVALSPWVQRRMLWHEKIGQRILTHTFRPIENKEDGGIYSDNSISLLTEKCAALVLARPFHAVAKTLYHSFLPVSIPREIYLAVKKAQKEGKCTFEQMLKAGGVAALKNIADIIRTPLYELVLTVLAMVGFLLGIFRSEKIYALRAVAGKVENSLNWGDKKSPWTLAPCFQKIADRKTLGAEWGHTRFDDTYYPSGNLEDIAKANIARGTFDHRRKRRSLFYCWRLWPRGVPLDSATYNRCG
jgi:hypothetical protein